MDSLRYAGQIVQSHSLKDAYIVQIGYYSSTHPTRCVRRADRVLPTRCVRRADRVLQQHTSYTLRTSCRLGTTAAHILHAAYIVQIGYYSSTHPTCCHHFLSRLKINVRCQQNQKNLLGFTITHIHIKLRQLMMQSFSVFANRDRHTHMDAIKMIYLSHSIAGMQVVTH